NRRVGRKLLVGGLLRAVGGPVALVVAGLDIEHNNAPVEIAVGHVELAGGLVRHHVGRASELGLAVGAAGGTGLANLLQELAVGRELEDLVVVLAVAGKPDVALLVDVDAVLALGPFVASAWAAPALEQPAVGRELQDRRRRDAAAGLGRALLRPLLVVHQRGRPVHDPHVVVVVHGDAGHLPEDPAVRQRLGPERIDGELRQPLGPGLAGKMADGDGKHGRDGGDRQSLHWRSSGGTASCRPASLREPGSSIASVRQRWANGEWGPRWSSSLSPFPIPHSPLPIPYTLSCGPKAGSAGRLGAAQLVIAIGRRVAAMGAVF